jgi:hypothetical protein
VGARPPEWKPLASRPAGMVCMENSALWGVHGGKFSTTFVCRGMAYSRYPCGRGPGRSSAKRSAFADLEPVNRWAKCPVRSTVNTLRRIWFNGQALHQGVPLSRAENAFVLARRILKEGHGFSRALIQNPFLTQTLKPSSFAGCTARLKRLRKNSLCEGYGLQAVQINKQPIGL